MSRRDDVVLLTGLRLAPKGPSTVGFCPKTGHLKTEVQLTSETTV